MTSLKSLPTAKMLEISARCLGEQHEQLGELGGMRGALGLLERAHQALDLAQRHDPAQADALRSLNLELAQLDLVHDRRVRGLYHLLTGLGEALDDESKANAYAILRDRLLPEGPATTLMNYEEQIAAARAARAVIDDAARRLLEQVELPQDQGTLWGQVEAWWRAAEMLEEVWQRRKALRLTQGAAGEAGGGDLLRARHQWIGAFRVLCATLDASSLSRAEVLAILPELQMDGGV